MTDVLDSLLDNVSNAINAGDSALSEADFVVSVRKKLEAVKIFLRTYPSVFNLILIDPDTLRNLENSNTNLMGMSLQFDELTPEQIREFLRDVNDVVQEFTFPEAVSPGLLCFLNSLNVLTPFDLIAVSLGSAGKHSFGNSVRLSIKHSDSADGL